MMKSLSIAAMLLVFMTLGTLQSRAGVKFYDDSLRMDHSLPREVNGPTPHSRNSRETIEKEKKKEAPRQDAREEEGHVKAKREPSASPWVHDPDAPPGYTPPEVVKRLFANPTRENAEAYVDWLIEENRKARKVVKLVQEVTKSRMIREEKDKVERLASMPSSAKPLIVAFLSASCPHCREQAMILDSLNSRGAWKGRVMIDAYLNAADMTQAKDFIKTVAPATYDLLPDGGKSRRLGVTTWPTLYIFPPGQNRRAIRIKGMADHRRLVKILDRMAGKQSGG